MATTLYHPTIPDVTVEVDGKDLIDRHITAGWKKTEPKAAQVARDAAEAFE
jgi:choline kinase